MATLPRFTIMREDLSYVWAREYGDARDATTILAALLAIGASNRVLVLSDDEGGAWALTMDISIPANVTLSLPAGVTLTGTGNLTIEGNLLALRHDWWQSTGTWTWHLSTATWMTGKARMYTLALDTPLAISSGGTGASTVSQAQSNLSLVPGTHVQPYDPALAAFADSTGSANTVWFFTGADVGALTPLTPYARTLLDDPDAATWRTTLGLKALALLETVGTPQIDNQAVTFAKIQPMTDSRLVGRAGASVGEISVGTGLALSAGVLSLVGGSVLGSGAANRAAYWTSAASQSYDDAYQYDPASHHLTVPKLTLTELGKALHIGSAEIETGLAHVFLRHADTLNAGSGAFIRGLSVIQRPVRTAISPTVVTSISAQMYLNQAGFAVSGAPLPEALALHVASYATGASGTVNVLYGLDITAGNQGGGHITQVQALKIHTGPNTGTITHYFGISVANLPTVTGNATGIYTEVSAGTNRWNIHADGTASNYFRGPVVFGDAVATRLNLGLGSIATQDANAVAITGGSATLDATITGRGGLYRPNSTGNDQYALYSELATAGGVTRYALRLLGDAPNYLQGHVGIGGAPQANKKVQIYFDKATNNGIALRHLNTDAGPASIGFENQAGSSVGYIATDATTTFYATTSDARLKHAVEQLGGSLDVIRALNPVRFRWNTTDEPAEGLLAHELQQVIPHAVVGTPDACHDDGSIVPQGVDYSKLVPHLVGAMQELLLRLETLEGRLTALGAA